ncbi:hypothetical protein CYMTET_26401 [Cymbomonas tetramitiformis]|uniref:Uncharacterized protein n=1 Tax=Cymbomonas tetramitiformis TaxID=36881 RepID=A0AAE0FSD7_9CHLO|nr:hypothetical protein CYMTET_26401 [Cymbomonas tetramitiformis]
MGRKNKSNQSRFSSGNTANRFARKEQAFVEINTDVEKSDDEPGSQSDSLDVVPELPALDTAAFEVATLLVWKTIATLRRAVKISLDVKQEVEQTLVDEIESHWTAEFGLALRLKLHLSQRKYQYLINHLSCLYVEGKDKFVRIRVGSGVQMPSLKTHASKHRTVSLMKEYFEEMDPQGLEDDPKMIYVSLHKVIHEHLATYPLAPTENELKIKVDGDGAPVMPRVSQTCIAVKVMRTFDDMEEKDWEGLNSPFTSHSILLFDGKEDWDVILATRLHVSRQNSVIFERTEWYAYPWTCPGCGEIYLDRDDLERESAPATNAKRLEYQLKVSSTMVWVGTSTISGGKDRRVLSILAGIRRSFIKIKKESKKQGAKKVKTPNVIGREIEAIVRIYEALMKLVHTEGTENYDLAMKAFRAFVSLYNDLLRRLLKGHTQLDRVKKVASIKKLAGEYIDAKLNLGSAGEDGTLYSHIAFWHFPEMILRHGDLVDLSTQALEHLHWLRKKDYRDLSNKGAKAMSQLMKTEWSRAKIKKKVATRETSTNKKRRAAAATASGRQATE